MSISTGGRFAWARRSVVAALISAVAPAWLFASPVAAANNIVVSAYFGDCRFAGSHAGSGKTVKIEWRDSDGNLKSKHSVTSNSAGNFTSRCELGELIEKGDELKTTIGTAVRSFTVPKVTVNVDRETNTVSGKVSPPPASLLVEVFTYNGGFSSTLGSWHTSTPVVISGDYSANSWDASPNIVGWDDVFVSWADVRGDQFVRYITAEAWRVWLRQQFIEVVGNPGAPVHVEVTDSSVTLLDEITGRADGDGRFSGDFLDADGLPLRMIAGDHVGAYFASDAGHELPNITATINKSTDRVTANCGLGSGYGIFVQARTRDVAKSTGRAGITDGSGNFLANFATSPAYNVASGDKVDVYCKFLSGDVVAKTFTVP